MQTDFYDLLAERAVITDADPVELLLAAWEGIVSMPDRQLVALTRAGKSCATCGVEKPRCDYYADKRWTDGLYASCKACHKAKVAKSSAS